MHRARCAAPPSIRYSPDGSLAGRFTVRSIEIEYGTDHVLEELLRSIDRPGDFCASRATVRTHGRGWRSMAPALLSFPVPEAQVRTLIGAAERAPYGRGPDTLVDTSVRDCWQIGSTRVRLSGKTWPDTLAKILDAVAVGLGCPSGRLDARLYKLLVYETGGFFSPHRDTEKADGMIATLSISFPTIGNGGELIVRHREREVTIDMNAGEPSELAFGAFYADCTHEIRPVTEGHRLSLVFNLCLRGGDSDTPQEAPDYSEQVDEIAKRLVEWRHTEDAAEKLVWLPRARVQRGGALLRRVEERRRRAGPDPRAGCGARRLRALRRHRPHRGARRRDL